MLVTGCLTARKNFSGFQHWKAKPPMIHATCCTFPFVITINCCAVLRPCQSHSFVFKFCLDARTTSSQESFILKLDACVAQPKIVTNA